MQSFNIFDPQTSIQGKFFLEASAGTGKTFTIEQIILRALIEGSILHIEEILAVTFTNAATKELKQRIQKNLRNCLEEIKLYLNRGKANLPPYLSLDIDVKQLYMKIRNAVATINRMSVFTIHGFCNFILQQYFPGAYIHHHKNPALTHTQLILHHIQNYLSQDLWQLIMSPEQFHLLTLRYNTTSKHTISLIDKLLANYGSQVSSLLPPLAHTQEVLQFWHTNVRKQIQNISKNSLYSQLLKYTEGFKKQSFPITQDLSSFVDLLYASETSNKLFMFSKLAQTFHSKNRLMRYQPCAIADLVLNASWLEHTEQFCNLDLLFNTLLKDIQKYLKQHYTPWISPDESIFALEELLSSPKAKTIISSIQERYRLVLIDEFQDTDKRQWQIFSTLFTNDCFSGSVFLIGDPKQSIYEWRNADLSTYLKAKSSFSKDSQLYLVNNHRSTPELMTAINYLFSKISPFLKITDYEPIQYHPLVSQSQQSFKNPPYSPIHFVLCEDIKNQALWISSEASRLQTLFDIPLGKMAILVSDSTQAFDLITHSSIPVSFSKNKSIFHLTETYLLTLAFLEAILYPENYENISKVLLSSFFGLSLSEILEKKEHYSEYFLSLRSYLSRYGLLATFYQILTTQGEILLKTPKGDLIIQEMEKLCSYLDTTSSNPQHKLLHLQFFSETGLWEEELSLSSYSEDLETLKITTIHSSKGLEYDIVFCPGLDKAKKGKSSSEWLREMYVACTRAKQQLYIPILTPSSLSTSALSHYVKLEGSHSTVEDFIKHLEKERPELFSFSLSESTPQFTRLEIPLQKPQAFSLTLPSAKKVFSFSSLKLMLDSQDHHESSMSCINLPSSHLPLGEKTGLLIHKILEETSLTYQNPSRLVSNISRIIRHTHLEGYETVIEQLLKTTFSFPLTFASQTFTLSELSPNKIFKETGFIFSQEEEFWQGVIDLFFEHQGCYYIIDWKTSFLGIETTDYSPNNLKTYIQKEKLDYQGLIYIDAAKRFLRQFDIHQTVEMGFLFIRGLDTSGNGFLPLSQQISFNPKAIQKYPVYR
ncbi:exodeoxyribonuclease V subunit beta [Chlamydia sp. 17-3921]|uniref:exodeoxyribonuclease V subunit beta n=1 Tax=Chlamydia sp. 17-3921 TaxID=2675798 RepID=UPI00191A86CA|nr:exodeoxyribonuclease V subunit beta [Chlamydia sp. 17-3921]